MNKVSLQNRRERGQRERNFRDWRVTSVQEWPEHTIGMELYRDECDLQNLDCCVRRVVRLTGMDINVLLQSILHISRPLFSTNGRSCSGIKLLITMPSAFAFSQILAKWSMSLTIWRYSQY